MANINIELIAENDLIVFTVEGDLSAEEILKYSLKYYDSHPTKFVLWDATKGSVRNITTDAFREIAREIKKRISKRSGGKTALVGGFDTDFGLSRMYEAFAEFEKIPIQYKAFRNIDDAMRWIKE